MDPRGGDRIILYLFSSHQRHVTLASRLLLDSPSRRYVSCMEYIQHAYLYYIMSVSSVKEQCPPGR